MRENVYSDAGRKLFLIDGRHQKITLVELLHDKYMPVAKKKAVAKKTVKSCFQKAVKNYKRKQLKKAAPKKAVKTRKKS